jgi:predicted ribonuclease YlaK
LCRALAILFIHLIQTLLQISQHQLNELENGEGFFNKDLSEQQKCAVIMLLDGVIDCPIQSLVGGAGCGKTSVVDELLLQLNTHHEEDSAGSAL